MYVISEKTLTGVFLSIQISSSDSVVVRGATYADIEEGYLLYGDKGCNGGCEACLKAKTIECREIKTVKSRNKKLTLREN